MKHIVQLEFENETDAREFAQNVNDNKGRVIGQKAEIIGMEACGASSATFVGTLPPHNPKPCTHGQS